MAPRTKGLAAKIAPMRKPLAPMDSEYMGSSGMMRLTPTFMLNMARTRAVSPRA